MAEGLVRVGFGRPGDGVGIGLDPFLIFLRRLHPFFFQVKIVLIPSGFGLLHPERVNLHRVLRTFIIGSTRFFGR